MLGPSSSAIPDRPNRPLVVKCGYENSTRRITFPSAASCRLDSLRTRVEECFHLSASPFFLVYLDDDGEEFSIRNEADLTEAIVYFVSGDDDQALSTYSGGSGANPSRPLPFSSQKITIRLDIVVEYDGPSLSDTSSLSSFRTGEGEGEDGQSEGSWRSSGYEESYRSYGRSGLGEDVINEEEEGLTEYGGSYRGRDSVAASMREALNDSLADLTIQPGSGLGSGSGFGTGTGTGTSRRSDTARAASTRGSASQHSSGRTVPSNLPLTGPESAPAPSLLTHSELGTRWLREQSRLVRRKVGPGSGFNGSARRYDSDEESIGSDEESLGDLALVRDARGKYYYSYQTETSSLSSRSEDDFDDYAAPSRPVSGLSSSSSASTMSAPVTPFDDEPVRIAEPAAPPVLAPDCSACGVRLDYMRYICQTCGEGEMWKENAPGKAAFVPPRVPSDSDFSDESSVSTEWAHLRSDDSASGSRGPGSTGSQTVYNHTRSRSGSMVTNASRGSLHVANGSASSPTSIHQRWGSGPTPPDSPTSDSADLPDALTGTRPARTRGYELCAACVEVHGIAHSKAAAKAERAERRSDVSRRGRKAGQLRHTFREKIWAAQGWQDLEYTEDSECTICRSLLFRDRFKCISCLKFDLCRSCYQKVDEIHPAHAFLSLPDKPLPLAGPSRNGFARSGDRHPETAPKPMRHPGAFCHNCLQDIVGPRFHCAVCPSWDLCIQCEGVAVSADSSGHTADHIMMKIPIPLASAEVEAVSRRARDRWFQQDSTTVAAAGVGAGVRADAPSSRSSSPTNDTVYAAATSRGIEAASASASTNQVQTSQTAQAAQVVNIAARDALDHGCRCRNCNEWIMGKRFQCANCPSEPEPYNLCSICELRSYRIHDPRHVFFKFDRPVHIPLQSPRPLLPLLYKSRAGEVPAGAVINPRDPTAYLKHVLHRETLCDIHGDQIRGVWLRCAHCAAGFDICQEAEQMADHDATHVFVIFKARVDMAAFRILADLSAQHSKPLLRKQVYLS